MSWFPWFHPKPKPQPPAPSLEVHLAVWDENAHLHGAEEGISVALLIPVSTGEPIQMGPLGAEHRLRCALPPGMPYGGWADTHIEVPGYEPLRDRIILAQDVGVQLHTLFHSSPPLPRLQAWGNHFLKATGERFTAVCTSEFNIISRYFEIGRAHV